MNHDAARAGVDALFAGKPRRLPQLRAHLEGCPPCREHYDRTARAFRGLSGRPEEMSPEELALFAPTFPGQLPARPRWPMVWVGALATAAAVALVVYVQSEPPEFSPRGGGAVAAQVGVRALCSRDEGGGLVVKDAASGGCAGGDRLSFVATARTQRFVAIALLDAEDKLELLVTGAEGAVAPGEEAVLPSSSTWRPGLRAVAISGETPVGRALAERCARTDCPAPLERREVPLGQEPR